MTDDTAIADLTLERYRLGELPPTEAARIAARTARDPFLCARLDDLGRSDAAIVAAYGQEWLTPPRTARIALSRPAPVWILAAAALVIVSAATLVPGRVWPWRSTTESTRIKGDVAALLVYRKAGASSERLTDGDFARAGDVIRVAYRASAPRFGVILSIDGRGVVTRHLPVTGDEAVALQPGDAVPLADAYELDDAPRWERFFLISGEAAFAIGPVIDAARKAAAAATGPPSVLALPDRLDQATFLLRKPS